MTGTRIHGYLIGGLCPVKKHELDENGENLKEKTETMVVFVFQDTEGKFQIARKIIDDVALLSWTRDVVAMACLSEVSKKIEGIHSLTIREFWHTLS